jgi:uncharacterized iron-regulated protein
MKTLLIPIFLLLPFIFGACCTLPVETAETQEQPQNEVYPAGTILSGTTGQPVAYADMFEDIAQAEVIYIGENHTDSAHHEIQLQIIREFSEKYPGTAIGVEMMDHTYQTILDLWSDGMLTTQEFIEKTHWYANWRFNYDLYKDIFELIRQKKIPLIGLNLPFHIPPKIAVGGLDNLLPEDAEQLPESIFLQNPDHRAYVEDIFKIHQIKGRENFEYFYAAQCTWEDAMADAIANHTGLHKMVVLVGNGHIIKKFGIPIRAFSRTPSPFRTIYLSPVGSKFDETYGDYIWMTEKPTGPPLSN